MGRQITSYLNAADLGDDPRIAMMCNLINDPVELMRDLVHLFPVATGKVCRAPAHGGANPFLCTREVDHEGHHVAHGQYRLSDGQLDFRVLAACPGPLGINTRVAEQAEQAQEAAVRQQQYYQQMLQNSQQQAKQLALGQLQIWQGWKNFLNKGNP